MGFQYADDLELTQIKVVGVGGGGGNAVNRMIASEMQGVEFVAVNTDRQVLSVSQATQKIQIGVKLTGGGGAGGRPDVGQRAAEESRDEIASAIKGTDMVFITAGMGGGTGTGAAPIVAEIAREQGILTIGIVTKPFRFEGMRRMRQAEEGIKALSEHVDSLVVIPNERLVEIADGKMTLSQGFSMADSVLQHGVKSISDLIKVPGFINLDFADVTAVMKDAGYAHMGIGEASGKDKAEVAARAAVASPLLETSINGAKGVIINITASPDIGLDEVDIASNMIAEAAHPDANIIWGVAFDDSMDDAMRITVIATGFDKDPNGLDVKKNVEETPVSGTQEENAKPEEKQDDDDFAAIIDIFNRGGKRN